MGEDRQAIAASSAASLAYPEYDLNVPVAGWWMHDASPAIVQAKVDEGYRVHDLDYLPSGNLTANLIKNVGVYQRQGAGWSHDLTDSALDALIANTGIRVVDIARRGTGASTRWAATWVSNAGTQARVYKVVRNQTQAGFESAASGYRVTSVNVEGGLFSGVMILNTGADARTQSFGVFSGTQIRDNLVSDTANCANGTTAACRRVADIAPTGVDQFYVVYEGVATEVSPNGSRVLSEGEQTFLVADLDYMPGVVDRSDSIEHVLLRLAGRPTKLKAYTDGSGNRRYLSIMATNGALPRSGDLATDNCTTAKLDTLVERQVRQAGLPGLTLGIMRSGKLVHAKGYGYRDITASQPLLPTDSVRIASVSKRIGRAAVLRLIEEGAIVPRTGKALTLQTKVFGEIFAYTPPTGASPNLGDITLQHLIDHMTGVRFDQANNINPYEWQPNIQDWINVEASLQGTPGGAFSGPPGTIYVYMNANYHMVGHVVAEVAKMTFENYAKTRFFDPLNLRGIRPGRVASAPEFPDAIQATNYALPEFVSWGYPPTERGDWAVDSPVRYPASSYIASPFDILRWQASLEGTAPGYRGLQNYAAMGNIDHGGYLPDVTIAGLAEFPSGAYDYTFFYATTSDVMNSSMFRLDPEVRAFITAEGANLPKRDLFTGSTVPPGSGILSFDNASAWTRIQGPGTLSSTGCGTLGGALSIGSGGFTEIRSDWLTTATVRANSASGAPTQAALDVLISTTQPNPFFVGNVHLYVDIPTASINHLHLGQVDLTPLTKGSFVTVSFPLSASVRSAIAGNHNVRFYVAFNGNAGAGPLIVDNLTFQP